MSEVHVHSPTRDSDTFLGRGSERKPAAPHPIPVPLTFVSPSGHSGADLGAGRSRGPRLGWTGAAAPPAPELSAAPLRTVRALTSREASRSSAPWTSTTAIAKPPTARMFLRSHPRSGVPQPSRCTTL